MRRMGYPHGDTDPDWQWLSNPSCGSYQNYVMAMGQSWVPKLEPLRSFLLKHDWDLRVLELWYLTGARCHWLCGVFDLLPRQMGFKAWGLMGTWGAERYFEATLELSTWAPHHAAPGGHRRCAEGPFFGTASLRYLDEDDEVPKCWK